MPDSIFPRLARPALDRTGWLDAPRLADAVLAVGLGVVTLPVVVFAALLVRLTSSGPVLYTQVRAGKGGRPFHIYKLRSMRHNCEAGTGAQWAAGHADPRITPVGRVLRRLHIDEMPQLWNVLRGDMALVGPRPERPEILDTLEARLPAVRDRLAVRPGLTGLAQIQQPADQTVDCFRRKLALDLVYVGRRSAWLDARILLGTVVYLAGASYPRVRRLARLPAAEGPAATDGAAEAARAAGEVPTPAHSYTVGA